MNDTTPRSRSIASLAAAPWLLALVLLAAAALALWHWGDAAVPAALAVAAVAMLGAPLLASAGRARRSALAAADRLQSLRREAGEHERSAAMLRANEQLLLAILDSSHVGIVHTDLDGRILMANAACCRMLGDDEATLRGRDIADFTDPGDRAEDALLLGAMKCGDSEFFRREKRFRAGDGTPVPVQLTVALRRDAAGQPQSALGLIEDLGTRLRLAEAERSREAAERSNQAKSEFVSRMSHELRTPLNAMLGFAQLLGLDRKPPLAEHQRAWALQIQQAGWHLLQMINDTLDLSRIESGMLELKPAALDAAPLVQAALAMVEAAAQKRDLRIEQHLGAAVPRLLGDETRVKQVLTNLLSNAVKYNVDGGRIDVTLRAAAGDAVEIVVADTGLGMTREQMDELFQPYNRLGRERLGVEGTGIGLVISRKLAEAMDGSLRAASVAGSGSTFILTLPRAGGSSAPAAGTAQPDAGPAAYRRRVVHYIEDNETNVEVMRGMLLRRPQVQLEVSRTGLDGLAAVRRRRPSLILLDLHLPDIDGLELLRHLQDDDQLCAVPVVVVSADATAAHVEAALTAGAAHYVTKPVDLAQLLAILDELLDAIDTHFG